VIFEDYRIVGFNYRMTNVQAAVGRKQLERLPHLVSRRRYIAAQYAELLAEVEELGLPAEPGMGPFQLAKLLRPVAEPGRSETSDAESSRPRDCDAARHHVFASRIGLCRRETTS
jgi:dTDP-4-amino-4,6-dideoxygalactose transaminase